MLRAYKFNFLIQEHICTNMGHFLHISMENQYKKFTGICMYTYMRSCNFTHGV